MGRRVVGEGMSSHLGLLPSPTAPRHFAILFRAARCRHRHAATTLPSATSCSPAYVYVRHCRVRTRVLHVCHVPCTPRSRLRPLLYQRCRGLPSCRPVSYVRKRLLRCFFSQ